MLFRYSSNKNGQFIKKAVVYTKEEHKIPFEKVDSDALRIVTRLKNCGFEAYIVGGAVRDLIIGKTPKDFDIATDATPSKLKKIFKNSRIIGRRFRIVHVFFGTKVFEVTTFRSIVNGSIGNEFGTMDEDVLRRDFTVNALYYDPLKEQVIDYVGGLNDINKKILKAVIPLDKIFEEDPVRMLRAAKYSVTIDCKVPVNLKRLIKKKAHLLSNISPSRLTDEMIKITNSGHAREIVCVCLENGIYSYLQPAATSLLNEDKTFESKYMESLKNLDELVQSGKDLRLGQKLTFLIFDFINSVADWKAEFSSNDSPYALFIRIWTEVRNFVLPMNPERRELEFAIRNSLRKIGVSARIPKNAFARNSKKH